MKKADTTNKVLLAFTLLFVSIATFSFMAFRETEVICSGISKKCSQVSPSKHAGGQMLWDDFSRRFISLVSTR